MYICLPILILIPTYTYTFYFNCFKSFPIFLALADDNHCKTRAYALDTLHSLVCAAKNLDKITADTINNITRGIVKD